MLPSRGFFKKNDCPFFEKGLCMRPHCHFRHRKKTSNENSSSADSQEDTLIENLNSIPLIDIDKAESDTPSVCENESSHSKSNSDSVEDKSNQYSLFAKLVNQSNPYEKISRHIPCGYTPTPQNKGAQPKNKTVSSNSSINSLSKSEHIKSVYSTINSKENLSNKDAGSNSLNNFRLNKLDSDTKDKQTTNCKSVSVLPSNSEYSISSVNKNEESMHYEPQSTSNSAFSKGGTVGDITSNYVPSKVTTSESKYTPNSDNSLLPNDYVPSKDKPKKEKYIPEATGNITNHIHYKPSDKSSSGESQYYPETKPGTSNCVTDYVPTQKTSSQASSSKCSTGDSKNSLTDFEFITSEIEMMRKLLSDDVSQADKEKESKTDLDKHSKSNKTSKDSKEKNLKSHDKSSSKHRSSSSHSESSKSKSKDSSSSSSRQSSHKSSSSSRHHSSSSRHHSSSKSGSSSSDRHKSSSKSRKDSSSSRHSSSSRSKSHRDKEKSKERHSRDKSKKSGSGESSSEKKEDDKGISVSSDDNAGDDLCNSERSKDSGGESSDAEISKKRKNVFSDENNKTKIVKKSEEEIALTDLDDDVDDDPDVVEKECLEIFNNYSVPTETNSSKKCNEVAIEDQQVDAQYPGKKRMAHSSSVMSDHTVLRHKTAKITKNTIKSAQEVMMERYKKIEKAKEVPAPTLQPPQPILGLSRPPVRIAAVSNIQQMLDAKKAIEEKISKGLKVNERSTIAQTISRGTSRVAHTPASKDITERPTISTGTKQVPRVKRQIYLDKLLLETNQIFPTKGESAEEALRLEEEVFRAHSASFSAYHAAYISLLMKTKRRVNAVKGETSSSSASRPKVSHSDVLSGGKKNFSVIKTKKVDISMLSDRHIYDELLRCKLSPEELKENGYPVAGAKYGYASCSLNFELKYNSKYLHIKKMTGNRRYCIRCSKQYEVDPHTLKQYKEGPETCSYHPGKKKSGGRNCERIYNCCNSSSSEGCATHVRHVTDCNNYENLPNCVRTLCKGEEANPGVFALDCEMVYTRLGYELARVTVVNLKKEVVYDTLVKPKYPIECYNTFYSGIEENMMEGVETTLKDVQAVLLSMFSEKTIIIGHSLDSDLRALHLIHDTVVDTAVVYKNEKYHPYKYSLKDLCAKKISKIIQENVGGHDSAEDAIAALEIMLNHVKEEVSKYDSLESYEADRKR